MNESVNRKPARENVTLGFFLGTTLFVPYMVAFVFGVVFGLFAIDAKVTKAFWVFVDWFEKPELRIHRTFYFTIMCWLFGVGTIAVYVAYLSLKYRLGL